MNHLFKDKYGPWALVTGASSGIGKALSIEIAKKGMNIILAGRNPSRLEQVVKEIQIQHAVNTIICASDLSDQEGIDSLFAASKHLEVGLLVLSAGLENNGHFTSADLHKELDLIDLNIVSTVKLTHHFAGKMELREKGGILLVSSLTAHMPSPFFTNYAATKSYILSFASSLYGELKPKGIDISVLSPGVTDTPMSKNTGINWADTRVSIMQPDEVAAEAIASFGKKLSIIPGRGNRIMAFISRKLLPDARLSVTNQKMMQKVIRPAEKR